MNTIYLFLLILNIFFLNNNNESQNDDPSNILNIISNKNNIIKDENQISEINIFVHGTADGIGSYHKHFGASGSWEGFTNNVKSKFIKKAKYQDLYNNHDNFAFFKNQMKYLLQEEFPMIMGIYPGLSEIKHSFEDCNKKNKCKHCISKISYTSIFLLFKKNQEKLSLANNKNETGDTKFFMFNWVGSLSSDDRSCAAEKFNKEIEELSIKYPHAKINIFGHSHGGTVILKALSLKKYENINNIICLGMPIGKQTYKWIEKINFNNFYNFYSNDDIAQNKDITFDYFALFRGRKVKNHSKVYNIEVKRKDNKKVHHGMFYMVNHQESIFPVISDLPLLFILLLEYENIIKRDTLQTDNYNYIIS